MRGAGEPMRSGLEEWLVVQTFQPQEPKMKTSCCGKYSKYNPVS